MTTRKKLHFDWATALKLGLLGGTVALYLCLVGLVETFGERDIIGEAITFGQTLLILPALGIGYVTAQRVSSTKTARAPSVLLGATLAGLLTGGMLALLVVIGDRINLRTVLISASPQLFELLRFNQGVAPAVGLLLMVGAVVGALGGGIYLLPAWARNATLSGLASVILMGLLRDILRVVFVGRRFLEPVSDFLFASAGLTKNGALALFVIVVGLVAAWLLVSKAVRELVRKVLVLGTTAVMVADLSRELIDALQGGRLDFVARMLKSIFTSNGLTVQGAIVVFMIAAVLAVVWPHWGQDMRKRVTGLSDRFPTWSARRNENEQTDIRWLYVACGIILILILPFYARNYLTNVMDRVGLYILMGLGLNIVVGFAGLLDLGYVAFFAIGAYTMGVLTTTSPDMGGIGMSFWAALPIAIGASVLAGIILGVPVLNMRGDYLAIVTLGFGEIIGKLAISNWLRPYIGGAQGVIPIPRPVIFGNELGTFQSLYYLILLGCVITMFIGWRLRDSRLGRAWMALREDEDVAEAMGINLVKTKLLAFAIGAAFAGAGGAIFASQVGSIYPHSFNILVSINILCLIIVGGIGSLPGVVVGSLFMVGLPEVLSELVQYRFLFYGAALVIMMLVRPEGLWPEATHKRELHASENEIQAALKGAQAD